MRAPERHASLKQTKRLCHGCTGSTRPDTAKSTSANTSKINESIPKPPTPLYTKIGSPVMLNVTSAVSTPLTAAFMLNLDR